MLTVQAPIGISPFQVDFPEWQCDARGKKLRDVKGAFVPFGERSCEGSVHIRAGATLKLSKPELAYLAKTFPKVKFMVLVRRKSNQDVLGATESASVSISRGGGKPQNVPVGSSSSGKKSKKT